MSAEHSFRSELTMNTHCKVMIGCPVCGAATEWRLSWLRDTRPVYCNGCDQEMFVRLDCTLVRLGLPGDPAGPIRAGELQR